MTNREKQTLRIDYKKPGLKLAKTYQPKLRHVGHLGFVLIEAYILAAGKVIRGDEMLEYQDIRVYLSVKHRSTGWGKRRNER